MKTTNQVDLDVYLFEENSSKQLLDDERSSARQDHPVYANAPFINQQTIRSVKKSDSVLSNEFYVGRENGLQLMPAPSIGECYI